MERTSSLECCRTVENKLFSVDGGVGGFGAVIMPLTKTQCLAGKLDCGK